MNFLWLGLQAFSVLLLFCVYLLLSDCVCVCVCLLLQVSLYNSRSFGWYHNCGKHLNSLIKFYVCVLLILKLFNIIFCYY